MKHSVGYLAKNPKFRIPAKVSVRDSTRTRWSKIRSIQRDSARRVKKLALVFLFAASAFGQIPDAPKPQPVTKTDMVMLGQDIAVHGLDVYSTNYMLHNGGHEKFLPDFISHHTPVMAAFSAAVVTSDFLGHRRLEKHHRKLANVLQEAEILSTGYWASHNLTIHK